MSDFFKVRQLTPGVISSAVGRPTVPYLVTLAAMMLPKLVSRRARFWGAAPEALGRPYFREQG